MSIKNSRSLYIISGILVLVVTIIISVYIFGIKEERNEEIRQADQIPEGKMVINTNAEDVIVDQIDSDPVKDISDIGIVIAENNLYEISYYYGNQGFVIILLDPQIQVARDRAEEKLLELLDIGEYEACMLTMDLVVSRFANDVASGIDYGLSFCDNSVDLPK